VSGVNVRVERNTVSQPIGEDHYGDACVYVNPTDTVSGIIIRDNKLNHPLLINGITNEVVNVSVDYNLIDCTGSAIHIAGSQCTGYTNVTNNMVTGTTLNNAAIWMDTLSGNSYFVDGNIMYGTNDSTGIKETSVYADASYGINSFIEVGDWYDLGASVRYNHLGTGLKTQIDGDTYVDTDLWINGDVHSDNVTQIQSDISDLESAIIYNNRTSGDFVLHFPSSDFGDTPDAAKYRNVMAHYDVETIVEPTIITENGGTWTDGDCTATINSVDYVQPWLNNADQYYAKYNSMRALAAKIAVNTSDIKACTYDSVSHSLIITPQNGVTITYVMDVSNITGTMTFTGQAVSIRLRGGNTSGSIRWAAGPVTVYINDVPHTATSTTGISAVNNTVAMTALAAAIATDTEVASAVYSTFASPPYDLITITPKAGRCIRVSVDSSLALQWKSQAPILDTYPSTYGTYGFKFFVSGVANIKKIVTLSVGPAFGFIQSSITASNSDDDSHFDTPKYNPPIPSVIRPRNTVVFPIGILAPNMNSPTALGSCLVSCEGNFQITSQPMTGNTDYPTLMSNLSGTSVAGDSWPTGINQQRFYPMNGWPEFTVSYPIIG
jgi:hypothetical protein